MNHRCERILRLYMNHRSTEALTECYALLKPSILQEHHGDVELASFLLVIGCVCHLKVSPSVAQDFYRAVLELLSDSSYCPVFLIALFNLSSAVFSADHGKIEEAKSLHGQLLSKMKDRSSCKQLWKGIHAQHRKLYGF